MKRKKKVRETKKITKREYKDSIFRMLFGEDKENLLSLYNALNHTNYTDTSNLSINTLKNAIYLNVKNDISFVLFHELMLYEHQSTINPNIPLRYLFYISDLLQEITVNEHIYSSKRIRIPEPRFVVFYNGIVPIKEKTIYRLSDLFEKPSVEPEIDLKITVLNINPEYNEDIKTACGKLKEYTIFIEKVRENQDNGMSQDEAIKEAVTYCKSNDILKDFLERSEAKMLGRGVLYEFDEEKYKKMEREEGREEGIRAVISRALTKGYSPREISEITDTPVEEILKMKMEA